MAQVRIATMPTATKNACKGHGIPIMKGFNTQGTRMLAGHTPNMVTNAIFQRGGGMTAFCPGITNQVSRPDMCGCFASPSIKDSSVASHCW